MASRVEKDTLKTLAGSELSPGHCVILNEIECPSGQLIAVIVARTDTGVACKYLNADRRLTQFNELNNAKGMVLTVLDKTTPVELFGVRVRFDPATKYYWCQVVAESTATYPDGEPRMWQEQHPIRYKARKDVLKLALQRDAD